MFAEFNGKRRLVLRSKNNGTGLGGLKHRGEFVLCILDFEDESKGVLLSGNGKCGEVLNTSLGPKYSGCYWRTR